MSALPDSKWVSLVIFGVGLLVCMLQLTARDERRRVATWLVYTAFLASHLVGGYLVLESMDGRVRPRTFAAVLFAEVVAFGLVTTALARSRSYRENTSKRLGSRSLTGHRKRRRG